MAKATVSLLNFGDDPETIRRAVELCGGFKALSAAGRVLIKPNLVMWDDVLPFPRYGVITTALVIEALVRLLKEHGCSDITIGEGALEGGGPGGSGTAQAFRGMGFARLEKRYGVKLVDFNRGSFEKVDFGDFTLGVAAAALETDFLLNVPVLKTHSATRVSLGFKNLKGLLNLKSKMFCHHREIPLDIFVQRLGEKLKPALTVIDGIYALDRGPFLNGTAHRTDIVIASREMYAADVAGTRAMGLDPAEVGHLAEHARRHGLSPDMVNLETAGEEPAAPDKPLKWDWGWLEDNSGPTAFGQMGIKGIYYPKYDSSICSGCSFLNNMVLILLIGAYTGEPFDSVEFLSGKTARSRGGYKKTFLLGNCIIRENRGNPAINEAVPFKGCPPRAEEIVRLLNAHGINARLEDYVRYRESLAERYTGRPQFVEEHFAAGAAP